MFDVISMPIMKAIFYVSLKLIFYLLNTGLPIVSRVQSSVLLVMPGRDGSKADIPTPNIRADPSHLKHRRLEIIQVYVDIDSN